MQGDINNSDSKIVSAMISKDNQHLLMHATAQNIGDHEAILRKSKAVPGRCLPDEVAYQATMKPFLSTNTVHTGSEESAQAPYLRLIVPPRTQRRLAEYAAEQGDVSKVIMESLQRLMQDPKAISALHALYQGAGADFP